MSHLGLAMIRQCRTVWNLGSVQTTEARRASFEVALFSHGVAKAYSLGRKPQGFGTIRVLAPVGATAD